MTRSPLAPACLLALSAALLVPGPAGAAEPGSSTSASASPSASAPPPAPAPAVRGGYKEVVRVDLVQLNFLATDAKGRPVTDLRMDEVEVSQGRNQQTIAFLQAYYTPRAQDAAILASSPPSAATPGGTATGKGETAPPAAIPDASAVSPGRWLILFFDTYTAGPGTRVRATEAARKFVQTGLHAGDRAAVVVFDGHLQAIQSFTSDPLKLEAAVLRAADNTEHAGGDRSSAIGSLMDNMDNCRNSGEPEGCAQRAASAYEDDRLREADALMRALILYTRSLTPIPDIKTLILFSEGFSRVPSSDSYDVATVTLGSSIAGRLMHQPDFKLEKSMNDLTQAAATARTSLFTVNPGAGSRVSGVDASRRSQLSEISNPGQIDVFRRAESNNRVSLVDIARLTGGKASEGSDVSKALNQVVDLAPGLYTVGYYPATNDGDVHDVRIRVKRKGVVVEARRKIPLTPTMPPVTGALSVVPDPCGAEGRRQAVLSLRLDRNRLLFEKVDRKLTANFSVFIRIFAEGESTPLFENYRFFNITNTPEEIAAAAPPDPAFDLTMALPCRALTVLVSVMDAAGAGRGEFQADVAP